LTTLTTTKPHKITPTLVTIDRRQDHSPTNLRSKLPRLGEGATVAINRPGMPQGPETSSAIDGLLSLTTPQFHVLLILFSKCYSSFDHSTCSLSVLRRYLPSTLGGVHLPRRAAVPNSPTLTDPDNKHSDAAFRETIRDYHALRCAVPGNFRTACTKKPAVHLTT